VVALAVGGGVEIDAVDNAVKERILPGDGTHLGGDAFPDLVGELADDGPDGLLRIVRRQREVEADELVVGLGELEGLLPRADFPGDAVQLVVEDIAEPLGEDEREDVVLVFRCVLGSTDGASGVPDPRFEGFGGDGWHGWARSSGELGHPSTRVLQNNLHSSWQRRGTGGWVYDSRAVLHAKDFPGANDNG